MSRRDDILKKLSDRTEIKDIGYEIDGEASPCFIWTGPTSGTGRGGGYGRVSLNGATVATHIVSFTNFFGLIPGKKNKSTISAAIAFAGTLNIWRWSPIYKNQRRRDAAKNS